MTVRAIYPLRLLMGSLLKAGAHARKEDVGLYRKLQAVLDTGAESVMLSGEDAEHVARIFTETPIERGLHGNNDNIGG